MSRTSSVVSVGLAASSLILFEIPSILASMSSTFDFSSILPLSVLIASITYLASALILIAFLLPDSTLLYLPSNILLMLEFTIPTLVLVIMSDTSRNTLSALRSLMLPTFLIKVTTSCFEYAVFGRDVLISLNKDF